MGAKLAFASHKDFKNWLKANAVTDYGIWLILDKAGGPKTLKTFEAAVTAGNCRRACVL